MATENKSHQAPADSNPYSTPKAIEEGPTTILNRSGVAWGIAVLHLTIVAGAAAVAVMVAFAATASYASGQSNIPLTQQQHIAVIVGRWALALALIFLVPRCYVNIKRPTAQNEKVVSWSVLVLLAVVSIITGAVAVWPNSGLESSDLFLYAVVSCVSGVGTASAVLRIAGIQRCLASID